MGCLFRIVFIFFLVGIFGAPVAAVLMAVDKDRLVAADGGLSARDAANAQSMIQRLDPTAILERRALRITATPDEWNSLLKTGIKDLRNAGTRVRLTRFGVIVAVTAEIPAHTGPLGRYVNVVAVIKPSANGLEVTRLAIGTLEIPPQAIKPVLRLALDHAAGAGRGAQIIAAVRSVTVAGNRITISLQPSAADLMK